MSRFMLMLYAALMWLAQPLLRLKLARRSRREPGYGEAAGERFGRYTQPPEAACELVWVHAVSLGEARTAAILVKALRLRHPGIRLLLTHGTATGRAEGAGLLRPGDVQVWQPWDSRAAVAGFFSHFKPRLGLLMETEVWPNLMAAARSRKLPVVLVNARLSDKSLQQALKLSPLSLPAYGALAAVYAQTEGDAARFGQLGLPVTGVFGNLKFDATPDAVQRAIGKSWRRALALPVIMFASSREGEEDLFLEKISAAAGMGRSRPAIDSIASSSSSPAGAARFLVVPRHPQRFDEVEALARKHGLKVSRRSAWAGGPADNKDALQADLWLGDTLGDMALYYSMSDVALLGGSFAPLGGQNLIEAAACGCPLIMGPHTFNFTEAAELALAAGAARRVADMPAAVGEALRLAGDSPAQASAGLAGLLFAERHRGATDRTLAELDHYL